jgi:hypothetical protein
MTPNKECYFDFGQLEIVNAKKVKVFVKNGPRELEVGDIIGGRRIIAINIKGINSDNLGIGMNGKITLDGMPMLTIGVPYDNIISKQFLF